MYCYHSSQINFIQKEYNIYMLKEALRQFLGSFSPTFRFSHISHVSSPHASKENFLQFHSTAVIISKTLTSPLNLSVEDDTTLSLY